MSDIPCVWARCTRPEHVDIAQSLAARLAEDGDHIKVHTTLGNHPRGRWQVSSFLTNAAPMLILWIGGPLDLASLQGAHDKSIPLVVLDADTETAQSVTSRWFPGKNRTLLAQLHAIYTKNPTTSAIMIRAGAPTDRTHAIGSLEDVAQILPYSEDERRDIAIALQTRPVWLGRAITPDEVPMLATAQRAAAARSHRLLLIVTPIDPNAGPDCAKAFVDAGFVTHLRSQGDDPEEATQVYVADLTDEDGLWLRVAPMNYAGGSLDDGLRKDPFEAAALGSVVIHGTTHGAYAGHCTRLLRAGASFSVSGAERLGAAVTSLLSADRVARMATAGWDVTSSGAEISKRLVDVIQDRLDGGPSR